MKSAIEWIEKGIIIFGILIYGYIMVLNVFMENVIQYSQKSKCLIPNILLIGIGILFIYISSLIAKKYKDKINRIMERGDKMVKILSVILFVVELIISYEILFAAGWDAGEVSWQAGLVAAGESKLDNSYFSQYTNNLLITFLYSLAYGFMGIFGLQMYGAVVIVVVQCFLNCLTGYLLYLISGKLFHSNKIGFLTWLVYGLWIGLMPWYMITYSDPAGMIFPIAILWIYQSMENKKAIWLKSILIGVLSFFGYQIKPTILIMYIAILIIVILNLMKDKEYHIHIKQICGLIVAFLIVFGVYKQIDIAKCMGFELDKEQELTVTHFAMMGLSEETNGVFNIEDVEYSKSFSNKKIRQEANIKRIKQRLKEYGFFGVAIHIVKKTLTNFNDGTFAWGKEGEFFSEELEKPEEIFSIFLKSLYYNKGKNRKLLNTYMQLIWCMMLLGTFLNCIYMVTVHDSEQLLYMFGKNKKPDLQLIVILALVGIFLFVSVFEARARYLYIYAPMYILMGVQGYFWLFRILGEMKVTVHNNK